MAPVARPPTAVGDGEDLDVLMRHLSVDDEEREAAEKKAARVAGVGGPSVWGTADVIERGVQLC